MISPHEFYDNLKSLGVCFFTGVPDSLLAPFCACLSAQATDKEHIIAANEGNAIAIAAGYHLASGKVGLVYMQNSGIGNALNPLISLVDEKVYKIPMLIIVGWRGQPGVKDEPQHEKQGQVTKELFNVIGLETHILKDDYTSQLDGLVKKIIATNKPIVLLVEKSTFSKYTSTASFLPTSPYDLIREDALKNILNQTDRKDFIISTTGKTSREIYEIREQNGQKHANDFLTVGSMGHASSIAFGMSLETEENIWCIDGDGAMLMHLGGLAIIRQKAANNFHYILINNGSHESVGGQATVGFDIDIPKILEGFGFQNIFLAKTEKEVVEGMNNLKEHGKSALVIYTQLGSRSDLGRPQQSPVINKKNFMRQIGAVYESTNL